MVYSASCNMRNMRCNVALLWHAATDLPVKIWLSFGCHSTLITDPSATPSTFTCAARYYK